MSFLSDALWTLSALYCSLFHTTPQGQRSALVSMMIPQWPAVSVVCPRSLVKAAFAMRVFLLVWETRGDGDSAGMGEKFVWDASSCESVCEDASDASKTAGAPAYSAMFDSLLWMKWWDDSPQLSDKEETLWIIWGRCLTNGNIITLKRSTWVLSCIHTWEIQSKEGLQLLIIPFTDESAN